MLYLRIYPAISSGKYSGIPILANHPLSQATLSGTLPTLQVSFFGTHRFPVPPRHSSHRFPVPFRHDTPLVSNTFLLQTSFFRHHPRLAFRHLFVQTSVNIYGAFYSYFHGSVQRYLNATKAQHLVHRDCSKRLHTHTLTHARTHARTHAYTRA